MFAEDEISWRGADRYKGRRAANGVVAIAIAPGNGYRRNDFNNTNRTVIASSFTHLHATVSAAVTSRIQGFKHAARRSGNSPRIASTVAIRGHGRGGPIGTYKTDFTSEFGSTTTKLQRFHYSCYSYGYCCISATFRCQ